MGNVQEGKYIERTVSSVQRIYIREELQEVVFRSVVNGVETQFERAIILRAHPVELELCERRIINGFRVHSKIPKALALQRFDTIIKQAMRLAEEPPTIIGLGATSAPLHGVAYQSLFAAVDKTIAMPWLIQNVRESDVTGSDCQGYYSRSMKLPHSSETHDIVGYGMVSHPYTCTKEKLWKAMAAVLRDPVRFGIKVDQVMVQDQPGFLKRSYRIISQNRNKVEHVRVNEAAQELIFKTIKDGKESDNEHVWTLATNPLRCEIHSRKASDQMRVRWELPHEQANEIFDAFLTASSQV